MADFELPDSRIEAQERAIECGMDKGSGDLLYLSKGQDEYNMFTPEQEKCYAQGPSDVDKPFFADMRDKLTGWFQEVTDNVSGAASSVPTNLQELKQSVDTGSTAGILRDHGEDMERRANQILSQIPGRGM